MPGKQNELTTFGTIAFAGLAGGTVVAILIAIFVMNSAINSDHIKAMINSNADSYQQQMNIRVGQLVSQLTNLAENPRLVQTLSTNDAAAKAVEETALTAQIPDAVRVRIFGLNEAEVDRSAIPPFSFTSLDLVNRVEADETVYPEAINANGRWIMSVATPVRNNQRIIGTLFVYLEMTALTRMIENHVRGEILLQQKVGSATEQNILATGGSKVTGYPATVRDLDNPNWKILYTPSSAVTSSSITGFGLILMPILVLFIVGLASVLVGTNRNIRLIRMDLDTVNDQLRDAAAGARQSTPSFNIESFGILRERLAVLSQRPATKSPPPKPVSVARANKAPADVEVVDIEMVDDEYVEDLEEDEYAEEPAEELEAPPEATSFDVTAFAGIFRAYDIRGIVGDTLTDEIIHKIGLAIGSEAEAQGEQTIVVGADGRVSSPDVREALIQGLLASGRDVVDIGAVATPMLYFATENSDTQSGVMVTGSHNPPDYNGFKIVIAGHTLVGDEITALFSRIQDNDFSQGNGELTQIDISNEYMDAILDDVVVAQPLKVVIDCGNGIASDFAPEILANLGCDVVPLYCEVDGTFPNHPPDPTIPENLEDLILTVRSQKADLGIALDGDGDRVIAVTADGDIVWPDQLLMLFAKDVVSRNPGSDVVYDIKCTRHLNAVISGYGGRPIISRSGHSYVKAKMKETDAVLGGELSGHICFGERWFGFDDGIYAAARLIEIVGAQTEGLAELLTEFPSSVATPEIFIAVDETDKFAIIDELTEIMQFEDGSISTIDGIRIDFADGWGLIRASNTSPSLTLRFEADDEACLSRIQGEFRTHLKSVREQLDFPS
ncbi:MAG: phosphomannomutase/phosphoglucomutase [Proteobacteria bacterium]|nr:phosphomannomutase/phosphoglucomutase [Pseudomonadota bacterium]